MNPAAAFRAALCAIALFAAPPAFAADPVFGVWRNAKETVHIDIQPCGASACGTVVWATPEAEARVLKVSGKTLVGLQLFRDMVRNGAGVWRGRAFVPDLNMTFSGFAQSSDGKVLRAKGCLLVSVLCRTQIWTRVE